MSEWTNHQFVLTKVTQNGLALAKADKSLKKDKEIVLAAVKQNYVSLQFADDLLLKDREFVHAVVKHNGLAIEFAHKQFTRDKEIVLAAVSQNGLAFALIDDSLKKDREVALTAVKENVQALKYVDESFKTDVAFVYSLFKHDKSYLQYFSSQSTTKWNEAFNNNDLYTKLSNDIVEKYSKNYLEEKELYYAIELSSLFTPKSKMALFSNQYTSTFMEKLIIFQILRGMNHEGLKNYDNTLPVMESLKNNHLFCFRYHEGLKNYDNTLPVIESLNYHLFCFRLDKFLEDNPSQPTTTNQLKNIIEKVTNNFNTSCYSETEVNEIMSFAFNWLSNEQTFVNDYKQILCKYNELRGDSAKIFKALNYYYNYFKENYDFISILGMGGEGVVFKVFHKESKSLRAMKFKYDPENSEESANETINLLKRTDIEGKIKCFDCAIFQNHLYSVMELGEETLSNYIHRNNENGVYSNVIEKGKLVGMLEIFIKLLKPLRSFHDNNILHSDIGVNEFVKIGDKYKIINVENALVIRIGKPISLSLGKYEYMSPESSYDNYSSILEDYFLAHNVGQITTSSDIFSLGCVLLKLLTNCPLQLDRMFFNDPDISKYSDNYNFYFTRYGDYFYSVASTNAGEMKLHHAIEKLINQHIDPLLGINELLTRCIITMIQRDSTKRLNCYFYKVILKNLLKYLKGEIPDMNHITKEISLLKNITPSRSYNQIANLKEETLNGFTNKENVTSENYKDVIFLILERINSRTSPSSCPISKSENYHLFCFRLDKFLGNYPSQTTNNVNANNFDISFYSETEVNEIMSFAINWLSNEQTFVNDYKQILCKYNELRGDSAKIFKALNYYYNYFEKDYDFISILGKGGEGVVFKVFHKESKSLRAMKFKYDPEDSEESANETINLLKRTDIEGKIKCFDCAIFQNHLYSVMELGEETLSNYIHRNNQMYNNESLTKYTLTEILEIFIKVLKSVQSIHDQSHASAFKKQSSYRHLKAHLKSAPRFQKAEVILKSRSDFKQQKHC